jgi:hypothetical protein
MTYEALLEQIVAALSKYDRHATLKLYPNRSGVVKDSKGTIVFTFSSFEELLRRLNLA